MRAEAEPRTTPVADDGERIVPELSVVMPCLNEARTIGTCIRKAQVAFERIGIAGEVVVADNGSTDGSRRSPKSSALVWCRWRNGATELP